MPREKRRKTRMSTSFQLAGGREQQAVRLNCDEKAESLSWLIKLSGLYMKK